MPAEKTQAPIHLEVRQVALAAKKAFDEGRLSAQTTRGACFYRDYRGSPCAIGAALDDDTARAFDARLDEDDDAAIGGLVDDGLVTTDDLGALTQLQSRHDRWARANGRTARASTRQAFLATLNSILGEV